MLPSPSVKGTSTRWAKGTSARRSEARRSSASALSRASSCSVERRANHRAKDPAARKAAIALNMLTVTLPP